MSKLICSLWGAYRSAPCTVEIGHKGGRLLGGHATMQSNLDDGNALWEYLRHALPGGTVDRLAALLLPSVADGLTGEDAWAVRRAAGILNRQYAGLMEGGCSDG